MLAEGVLGPAPCTPAFHQGLLAPRPLRLASRLTDLGLPTADPSLCSSPNGLARRFDLGSLILSRCLCRPSPVSSAAPLHPAWQPLWAQPGPQQAPRAPSSGLDPGPTVCPTSGQVHRVPRRVWARGPLATRQGSPAIGTPPQTLLPALTVTPGGRPGSRCVRK